MFVRTLALAAAVTLCVAGCSNAPRPTNQTLDTGIGATGSAGMSGGAAAAPRGNGAVSTTTVR